MTISPALESQVTKRQNITGHDCVMHCLLVLAISISLSTLIIVGCIIILPVPNIEHILIIWLTGIILFLMGFLPILYSGKYFLGVFSFTTESD